MNCPVCKTAVLKPVDIEEGLAGKSCPKCNGLWIGHAEYCAWFAQRPRPLPERASPAPVSEPETDSPAGKLCPQCGAFLRRDRVGRGLDFSLDHCAACGGVWLDSREWDALKARNLHDDLHWIFTDEWRRGVRAEDRAARQRRLYVELLGQADYERALEFRAWARAHAHFGAIKAILDEGLS
jgi:Zn-finger nucleic acid-binding protein